MRKVCERIMCQMVLVSDIVTTYAGGLHDAMHKEEHE